MDLNVHKSTVFWNLLNNWIWFYVASSEYILTFGCIVFKLIILCGYFIAGQSPTLITNPFSIYTFFLYLNSQMINLCVLFICFQGSVLDHPVLKLLFILLQSMIPLLLFTVSFCNHRGTYLHNYHKFLNIYSFFSYVFVSVMHKQLAHKIHLVKSILPNFPFCLSFSHLLTTYCTPSILLNKLFFVLI